MSADRVRRPYHDGGTWRITVVTEVERGTGYQKVGVNPSVTDVLEALLSTPESTALVLRAVAQRLSAIAKEVQR